VKALRRALLGRPHTVVVNVPYRREDPTLFERTPHGDGPAGGHDQAAPHEHHDHPEHPEPPPTEAAPGT
jgi:hypothetical protein